MSRWSSLTGMTEDEENTKWAKDASSRIREAERSREQWKQSIRDNDERIALEGKYKKDAPMIRGVLAADFDPILAEQRKLGIAYDFLRKDVNAINKAREDDKKSLENVQKEFQCAYRNQHMAQVKLVNERDHMRTEYDNMTEQNKSRDEQLARMEEQVETLSKQSEDQQARLTTQEARLAAQEASIAELRKMYDAQRTRNEKLEAALMKLLVPE